MVATGVVVEGRHGGGTEGTMEAGDSAACVAVGLLVSQPGKTLAQTSATPFRCAGNAALTCTYIRQRSRTALHPHTHCFQLPPSASIVSLSLVPSHTHLLYAYTSQYTPARPHYMRSTRTCPASRTLSHPRSPQKPGSQRKNVPWPSSALTSRQPPHFPTASTHTPAL
jgi:hypothetical protein